MSAAAYPLRDEAGGPYDTALPSCLADDRGPARASALVGDARATVCGAVGAASAQDPLGSGDVGLARAVEANECDAYRSLFEVAEWLHGRGAFVVEDEGGATMFGSPMVRQAGLFNRVLGLGLGSRVDPHQLREISDWFVSRGVGLAVDLAPHALTEPLSAELRVRGLRRGAMSAMVVRRPSWLSAAQIPQTWPTERFETRRHVALATDATQRRTVASICATVFALDATICAILESLGPASGWQHWLVHERGRAAAAGLSFISGDRCWFGWAATLPEHRGCGLKGALDDTRVAHALACGCSFISSNTAAGTLARTDPSLRSFRRRGFSVAYRRATYLRPAAVDGACEYMVADPSTARSIA